MALVVDRVLAALVVDGLGAAEVALEMAVAYAKERTQFGRPIGSFQAVQHLCADMLLSLELGRAGAYYALWAADEASPAEAHRAATMAKAFAGDAFFRIGANAIQVFGGIGFTWEHDVHLFYKRLLTLQQAHGTATEHLEELADLVLAPVSSERVSRRQPASGPPPAAATATSGSRHLTVAALAPELGARLVQEPVAVEATARELAAVGVERDLAADAGDALAALDERPALALGAEPERLQPGQGDEAEAVVELGHADVGGLQVGARPHHGRRVAEAERGEVLPLVPRRPAADGAADGLDADGRLAQVGRGLGATR